MLSQQETENLIGQAMKAREYSYSPYSGFSVGAALLCKNGQTFRGCNIENTAFGPSNCAERTAFFKAVSEGNRDFCAIAIVGGKTGEELKNLTFPCGVCRQVMAEFCKPDFLVIVAKSEKEYKVYPLQEILPHGFGAESLV